MEAHAANDQPIDDEVAFWRGFITWWARQKIEPVPIRAWEALERAQRRAELAEASSYLRMGAE